MTEEKTKKDKLTNDKLEDKKSEEENLTNQKPKNENIQYPPPSFSSLVMSIVSATVRSMGLEPNNQKEKDMSLARYNIDLLDLLTEKTKNNLNEEEKKLLESCVTDLQIQFVNIKNKAQES